MNNKSIYWNHNNACPDCGGTLGELGDLDVGYRWNGDGSIVRLHLSCKDNQLVALLKKLEKNIGQLPETM